MHYLVDSDLVIDFLADDPRAVALFDTLSADGVAVSIISYMETYQGVVEGRLSIAQQAKFDTFFAGVPVLPLTPAIARRCASLRSTIKQQGKSVRRRALDLIVAATALEHELELVTRNTDDYKDIPRLTLYQPSHHPPRPHHQQSS